MTGEDIAFDFTKVEQILTEQFSIPAALEVPMLLGPFFMLKPGQSSLVKFLMLTSGLKILTRKAGDFAIIFLDA